MSVIKFINDNNDNDNKIIKINKIILNFQELSQIIQ